jgi:hypothetical protein
MRAVITLILLLPIAHRLFKTRRCRAHLNRVEDTSPAEFFACFQSCRLRKSTQREKKEGFMKKLIQSENSRTFIILIAGFIGVALLRSAQGVVPAPDGGYPGFNTAEGQNALKNLTTGVANAAVGWYSLFSNTDGSFNTAVGAGTLVLNVGDQSTGDGTENTAIGAAALLLNTTGSDNTAVGVSALQSNAEGNENTASGAGALQSNTAGGGNTANGFGALFHNTAGNFNTATGVQALFLNTGGATTGTGNTANGAAALVSNTIGNNNTAIGFGTLSANNSGNGNTAIGRGTLSATTGDGNTALGANAGNALTTGVNNIDIGLDVIGAAGESNTIRIGNLNIAATFIRGISGTVVAGTAVVVDADGQLGVTPSSKRFKEDIKPMDKASEALLALKPVTFRYKKEIDPAGTSQFGLVAEEVEKINPDLVVRDEKGRPYSVRYEQVNAMLLNEFLKEHRKVEHLTKDFHSKLVEQEKQIEALTAGLQKVNAQLELNRTTPHMVLSNR